MHKQWKRTLLLAAFLTVVFSFPEISFAKKIDWDELEKKAKKYTGKRVNVNRNSSGNKRSSVNIQIPSRPTSRIVDTTARMLSEKDKRYILVHMKLANRNFMAKKYDRAIQELESVFDRQPDHGGGRFMRAVIAARKKDYMTAWQNIIVAKEKDPDKEKIDSFVEKLTTVMPRPERFLGVPGIYRPVPISACEKAADVIERYLKEPLSSYLIEFSTEELKEKGSGATMVFDMRFSATVDADQTINIFKLATGGDVTRLDDGKDPKHLRIRFELFDLPIKNPDVKPVSGLIDFVRVISEQADVAISDTIERDREGKILETTYEIAGRSFSSLNDFLRKASPYAHLFRVLNMRLSHIIGSQNIIWQGKIRIDYQLE
jgi:hypothetical protein